jgi:hypothetical protein
MNRCCWLEGIEIINGTVHICFCTFTRLLDMYGCDTLGGAWSYCITCFPTSSSRCGWMYSTSVDEISDPSL